MQGASELSAKLKSAPDIARRATVAATKTSQTALVRSVRAELGGAPRWGHRGKSRVYRASVDIGGRRARHVGSRGGPPGKFTGALQRGVGGKKTPLAFGSLVVGGVGVGGSVNNLKKNPLERRYPYFGNATRRVEAEIPRIYAAAWGVALAKIGL